MALLIVNDLTTKRNLPAPERNSIWIKFPMVSDSFGLNRLNPIWVKFKYTQVGSDVSSINLVGDTYIVILNKERLGIIFGHICSNVKGVTIPRTYTNNNCDIDQYFTLILPKQNIIRVPIYRLSK
jgi:hypothetical protein